MELTRNRRKASCNPPSDDPHPALGPSRVAIQRDPPPHCALLLPACPSTPMKILSSGCRCAARRQLVHNQLHEQRGQCTVPMLSHLAERLTCPIPALYQDCRSPSLSMSKSMTTLSQEMPSRVWLRGGYLGSPSSVTVRIRWEVHLQSSSCEGGRMTAANEADSW